MQCEFSGKFSRRIKNLNRNFIHLLYVHIYYAKLQNFILLNSDKSYVILSETTQKCFFMKKIVKNRYRPISATLWQISTKYCTYCRMGFSCAPAVKKFQCKKSKMADVWPMHFRDAFCAVMPNFAEIGHICRCTWERYRDFSRWRPSEGLIRFTVPNSVDYSHLVGGVAQW